MPVLSIEGMQTKALLAAATLATLSAAPSVKSKQFLNVGSVHPPGYTHVVTSPPGRMIFISGVGGVAADGSYPDNFAAQAVTTFTSIAQRLELAGASFKDIVKINYYVTDLSHTSDLRRIRAQYLNMDKPPAATLVQAGLGKGLLLEVEAVAIVPE